MKKILLLIALAMPLMHLNALAIDPPYPEGPGLEFVCELQIQCSNTIHTPTLYKS